LYFSSDRSGKSLIYRAKLTNNGLFLPPAPVIIEISGSSPAIRFFTVIPNAQIADDSDMIIFSDENNMVYKTYPDISTNSQGIENKSGVQLKGIVLGMLPPGANFAPSFTIPKTNFGLVIAETNSSGEYKKIAVYTYTTNFVGEEPINAVTNIKNFTVDNEILYGGGSWVPGSIIGYPTDFFLHTKNVNGVSDVFVTDFKTSDIQMPMFSSIYNDSSPFYSTLDNKLYFTSKAYSEVHNFNMFRWNYAGLGPYLLTILGTGTIIPTLDTERPVVSITSPTNNGELYVISGQPITGTASDDSAVVSILIRVRGSVEGPFSSWFPVLPPYDSWSFTSSVFSVTWSPAEFWDIQVYAVDAAFNYSFTNTIFNVQNMGAIE
ncbi:MAG: hypothetical protein KAS64_08960, partial [Spirochaetes bacterium]|nr:hypothetical protein [Spirochaetota bacterium]